MQVTIMIELRREAVSTSVSHIHVSPGSVIEVARGRHCNHASFPFCFIFLVIFHPCSPASPTQTPQWPSSLPSLNARFRSQKS